MGIIAELTAATRLNADTPAQSATLWALTWQPVPRLVFDAGVEVGLNRAASNKRIFAGVTYAFGNLYSR